MQRIHRVGKFRMDRVHVDGGRFDRHVTARTMRTGRMHCAAATCITALRHILHATTSGGGRRAHDVACVKHLRMKQQAQQECRRNGHRSQKSLTNVRNHDRRSIWSSLLQGQIREFAATQQLMGETTSTDQAVSDPFVRGQY